MLTQQLQVLQGKVAKDILDKTYSSSTTDALNCLNWKSLLNRRKPHRCIFIYNCINNNIGYDFNLTSNGYFHNCKTRNRNNLRKTSAKRQWGHASDSCCSGY